MRPKNSTVLNLLRPPISSKQKPSTACSHGREIGEFNPPDSPYRLRPPERERKSANRIDQDGRNFDGECCSGVATPLNGTEHHRTSTVDQHRQENDRQGFSGGFQAFCIVKKWGGQPLRVDEESVRQEHNANQVHREEAFEGFYSFNPPYQVDIIETGILKIFDFFENTNEDLGFIITDYDLHQ